MAFSSNVTTTTDTLIMPYLVDSVIKGSPLFQFFGSSAKRWTHMGETVKFPVKISKNSTGGSFSAYDIFSANGTLNRVNLSFGPKFYQISVALPLDALSVNSTDARVLDLAQIEVGSAARDMAEDIGVLMYSDGTGNSSKDFLGLSALVDDGATVANIGGQARSTYSSLQSTTTASGGKITLAALATLFSNCAAGNDVPTDIFTTRIVADLIEQLMQPQERVPKDTATMKNGVILGSGATLLYYKGMPIRPDDQATSQTLYMINRDYIDFYALPLFSTKPISYSSKDIKGTEMSPVKGIGFTWSDWITPTNSASVVAHIYTGGEFITTNPARHGKLTGVTSV